MRATKRKNEVNNIIESINRAQSKQLDIHGLKRWAKDILPKTSQIRSILLLERELLTVEEFIAKMDIWLKLIDMETNTLRAREIRKNNDARAAI
jgi:hypothetical protein